MSESRNTKQKSIIINYLKEHENEHLSIEKIQNDLEDKVGMATIYRLIKNLCIDGCISKIPLNKQGFCYKYTEEKCKCSKHLHLICKQCGNIEHLKTDIIPILQKQALKENGFDLENDKITLYGICKDCRR